MTKKYIHYDVDRKVYAIYYQENKTIYYNLDAEKGAKHVIVKQGKKENERPAPATGQASPYSKIKPAAPLPVKEY